MSALRRTAEKKIARCLSVLHLKCSEWVGCCKSGICKGPVHSLQILSLRWTVNSPSTLFRSPIARYSLWAMHESSERTGSWDVAFMENEAEGVSARKETGKQLCTLSNQEICAACQQNFHNREPMLLPCLHSLCKTCVPLPWRSLMVPDQPGASPVDQGSKPRELVYK